MSATMTLDGVTFSYEDTGGGGEVVLLVHGHPFDRSMWDPQTAYLARSGRRVIAPDLRGYGESTVIPGKTPLETFARDLAALLDHLEIEDVVLVGLSMGGQIALEFHRLFSGRLRGLVLADTSAPAEPAKGRRARYELADRLRREGLDPYAHEVLPKMVAPHNLRDQPEVAEHVLGMMRATSAEGAGAALRGRAERPDYVAMLADIAVPTLVVVGDSDEFTPLSDARLLHEGIDGSTLAVIEGAAHLPNLERPVEFNTRLEAHLAAIPSREEPVV